MNTDDRVLAAAFTFFLALAITLAVLGFVRMAG